MAILDTNTNAVVVRIVYAGQPGAGKTTTIRALASLLFGNRAEQSVVSPGEVDGETLYFDWLDYVGGSFRGRRVRCQIVTIPDREELIERRRLILESADAVVFVVDSRPRQIKAAFQCFQETLAFLARADDQPPAGVIVQANKRDLDDVVAVEEIKQGLHTDRKIGFIATTATLGKGVREAFVMSVSLALERVAALLDANRLEHGKPRINNAQDLLALIDASEQLRHAEPVIAEPEPLSVDTSPIINEPLVIEAPPSLAVVEEPMAEPVEMAAPPVIIEPPAIIEPPIMAEPLGVDMSPIADAPAAEAPQSVTAVEEPMAEPVEMAAPSEVAPPSLAAPSVVEALQLESAEPVGMAVPGTAAQPAETKSPRALDWFKAAMRRWRDG
ncbi:MAG: ADP-ribosylation factor-like protein [Gammaproteobacteria bacterium]